MIHNEMFSTNDLPDELHHVYFNLVNEIRDALYKIGMKKEYEDSRLFISALSFVHAAMLSGLIHQLGDDIDIEEYLRKEMEVLFKNIFVWLEKYKTPGI